jgi:hypothetical protein
MIRSVTVVEPAGPAFRDKASLLVMRLKPAGLPRLEKAPQQVSRPVGAYQVFFAWRRTEMKLSVSPRHDCRLWMTELAFPSPKLKARNLQEIRAGRETFYLYRCLVSCGPAYAQASEKAAADLWQFGKSKWQGVAPLAATVCAHFFSEEAEKQPAAGADMSDTLPILK